MPTDDPSATMPEMDRPPSPRHAADPLPDAPRGRLNLTRILSRVWHGPRRGERRSGRTPTRARLLTGVVCLLAGLMIVASALSSRGTDLRPDRNTDLVGLLNAEKTRNSALAEEVRKVRLEVDRLTAAREPNANTGANAELQRVSGLTPVFGPSITVTLTDAPAEVQPIGVDDDELVVHQQDIQAVMNALWRGGAEAMTIQGQRVVSTTGIKCVGNTVVLHGVPYAPPYVITAIGDPVRLAAALESSPDLDIFKQYVAAYGLGWHQQASERTELPGYEGPLSMKHAKVPGSTTGR